MWRYVLLVLAAVVAGSCSRGTPEGRGKDVVLYSSVDEPYLKPILTRFEEASGIHVRLVTDAEATKTAGLAERLEAERDRPRADVYWGNEIFHTIRLAQAGVLDAYRPSAADGVPPRWRDANDRFVDVGLRMRMIAVSTREENRAAVAKIKGVADLANPELHDRIAICNPAVGTASGQVAALYVELGPARFKDLMLAWKKNGMKLLGGNSVVADQVAGGNLVAGLTDNDDLHNAKADGGKIDGVVSDQETFGTLLVPTTVALVKGGPNGDAGRKLIDFIVRPEVERELIDQNFLAYSTRGGAVPAKAMNADYEELARVMPEAVRLALEILEGR